MLDTKETGAFAQMEMQLEEEKEYGVWTGLFGVSVSKHLLDGHFTVIWGNDVFYRLVGCSKSEYETRFHNHSDEYFHSNPESFQYLVRSVEKALEKGEKGISICLKMSSMEGAPSWVKLQVAFNDEYVNGFQVAYTTMVDVTEMVVARKEQEKDRKTVEKMANEQDMLMGALNVSVSRHLLDDHYTCIRANEYYYQLIGYTKERYEALFHNHCDEYYKNNPEGWKMLVDVVTKAVERDEKQYAVLVPMKYEDGSSFWVRLFGYFTDEYVDGCRCAYTVMTDVTDLVQMKNEQEMLMQAMRVSVSRHLVDEHFTVVWANDFYYQLIGYSKKEYETLFRNRCDEYFHSDQRSWNKIHEKIQEMYAAGERSYEVFLPMKIPDGSTRWVKMTGFFTDEYQDGKQLAYTTMVDVTDLMQIQQEKAVAYDNIPGFIVKHRILPDRIIMIDASESFKEVFSVDFDDMPSFDIYAVLEPESRDVIIQNHPQFRCGEPFEGTIHVKDKNAKERWFQIHSTCIDFIGDDPVYLTVFIDITDITELRELQHKLEERTRMLNDALEEAKRANAAKSDFLSRMSHDIRTPMNAIFGMTTIAGAHVHEPERITDCLDKITVSSKLLLSLINEVLDMSKIESGRIVLAEEEADLVKLVREIVTIVQPQIDEKDLRFKFHFGSITHRRVISDAQRIQQLLLNLLSNAVKYTPAGGNVLLEIDEMASEHTGKACYQFLVSDSGIGMEPEFLDRVFDPFERADDERIREVQGTGLGLSICKSIAELMGGTIQVESTYREGSRFTVTVCLPIIEEEAAGGERTGGGTRENGSVSAVRAVMEPAAGGQFEKLVNAEGKRILLVEDNALNREIAVEILESTGAAVDTAKNGKVAVEMVEHSPASFYDLIFMDMQMPVMDGCTATVHIRALPRQDAKTVPIIAMTANAFADDRQKTKEAGMDGHLAKPIDMKQLRLALMKWL